MPKVSIIFPVYNTEKYLPRCLSSILSQSFTDFELLLVDDGSTDGSGAICDAFAEKDGRIRVFHKENGGVSSARNLGLDEAKGEWIYFVDSDDEVLPNGLKTLADGICDEVDIVMGGYEEVDEYGVMSQVVPECGSFRLNKRHSIITQYLGYGLWGRYWGYLWVRLLKRDIVNRYNIRFDTNIAIKEDTLYIMQYVCRSNGITQVTANSVYRYWIRSDSAMGGIRQRFDYKYVSSFYAFVGMKHEVEIVFPKLSEPVFVAKQGVFGRYYDIIRMMDESCVKDEELKRRLYSEMKEEVGTIWLFKLRRKWRKWMKSNKKYQRI